MRSDPSPPRPRPRVPSPPPPRSAAAAAASASSSLPLRQPPVSLSRLPLLPAVRSVRDCSSDSGSVKANGPPAPGATDTVSSAFTDFTALEGGVGWIGPLRWGLNRVVVVAAAPAGAKGHAEIAEGVPLARRRNPEVVVVSASVSPSPLLSA